MVKKRVLILIIFVFVFSFIPIGTKDRPTVALVLSGGGARGLAHIPVIEEIERFGIPIDMVLGTSMGALVGGLYAAGYSPSDMRNLIEQTDLIGALAIATVPPLYTPLHVFQKNRENLFSFEFDKGGLGSTPSLIGDQQVLNILNNALSKIAYIDDFDSLEIPFRCIGTDIISGQRLIFSQGSLVSAIRGSISIPVLFSPYPIGKHYVVDGGLVDNMPIALAKEMGADIVIAVDVNAVDYEVDVKSVNSITSLLNQLIVVLTKNTITNQTQLADLIIEPPLFEQTVLDFHKASEILQVGEAAVESYQEQLKTIAAVFEQLDALDVKDPNRQGTYFALDDVYIATVSHKALDVNITEFDLKPFNSFIGYPFNDLQKETITAMFDKIRERERYATLTFAYTDAIQSVDGKIWGNLEVQTRAFEKRRSEVAAGVYGSTSLIFAKGNQAKLDFIGDLKVRYSLYSVVDWSVEVANEDAFSVFTAVSKRFAKKWVGGVEVGYVSGGIHPTNLRSSFRGVAFRDRAFISCISIKWDNQDTALIKLKSNLDYVSFGNPDLTINKKGFIPSFSIEALYSTLTYGFFPQEGLRGDFLASGELTKQFDYRLAAQFLIAIPISNNDTISFKVNGSSATATLQRSSSYYDYGGVRGIATYSTTTLVDQMVLLGFDYYHFFKKKPLAVVLYSSFKGGFKGDIVSDCVVETTALPFSNLKSYDLSAAVALGLSFATTDLLIGVALDNNLKVALFIEVL